MMPPLTTLLPCPGTAPGEGFTKSSVCTLLKPVNPVRVAPAAALALTVGFRGAEALLGAAVGLLLLDWPCLFMESISLAAAADRCRLEGGRREASSLSAQRAWAAENWRREAAMPSLRRDSSGLPRPRPVCIEFRIIGG